MSSQTKQLALVLIRIEECSQSSQPLLILKRTIEEPKLKNVKINKNAVGEGCLHWKSPQHKRAASFFFLVHDKKTKKEEVGKRRKKNAVKVHHMAVGEMNLRVYKCINNKPHTSGLYKPSFDLPTYNKLGNGFVCFISC